MLKLFYITNNPQVAQIAEKAGVDRIFVDMEYIGKEERQHGMNTVKNHHTIEDVQRIRQALSVSELLVRVNPIHEGSEKEIDAVVQAGADVIMLPMWKSADDVKAFLRFVNGRAKTLLLLETDEAAGCIDDVLQIDGIDEIHIGLNDLHLSQHKKFLFELVVDGTVDVLANKIKHKGIPFGFGGVGRVKVNVPLPAENILCEHYRLGSDMVILSKAFCNADNPDSLEEIRNIFMNGVRENRKYEASLKTKDSDFFSSKHSETAKIINGIVNNK